MIWFLLSISAAFFVSIQDVIRKKALKNIDNYVFTWGMIFFSFIFLVPLLFFIEIPKLWDNFFYTLFIAWILNTITAILYVKALKESDLSLVSPIVTFTPLFLLITSPIILAEYPNIKAILWVIFVVFWAYILNIKEYKNWILKPILYIFQNSWARNMFIVAFLWSITSNLDKIWVSNSSPIFRIISTNIFIFTILSFLVFYKTKNIFQKILPHYKIFLCLSFLHFTSLFFQMTALSLLPVIYVITLKRLSAMFSVFFWHFIFKEKNIKHKIIWVIIMLIWTAIITFLK